MSESRLNQRLQRIAASPSLSLPSQGAALGTKSNKRAGHREKTYKFGTLSIGRNNTIKCIVLDISSFGARISLENATRLPLEARLSIPQMGFDRKVNVRWQKDSEAGVSF